MEGQKKAAVTVAKNYRWGWPKSWVGLNFGHPGSLRRLRTLALTKKQRSRTTGRSCLPQQWRLWCESIKRVSGLTSEFHLKTLIAHLEKSPEGDLLFFFFFLQISGIQIIKSARRLRMQICSCYIMTGGGGGGEEDQKRGCVRTLLKHFTSISASQQHARSSSPLQEWIRPWWSREGGGEGGRVCRRIRAELLH